MVAQEEAGKLFVGIEQVAVLVGAVERALAQGAEQGDDLVGGEHAGAEDGDLALEHRGEMTDGKSGRGFGETQEVVGVPEAVGAAVGAQRMIGVVEGAADETRDGLDGDGDGRAGTLAVNGVAVTGAGLAGGVNEDAAVFVVETIGRGERGGVAVEDGSHFTKQDGDGGGHRHVGPAEGGQHLVAQVGEETAQVGEGDDGKAVADEGVVGVVPLGTLGVHPDAAAGHEVGETGEDEQEELLGEVDVEHAALRTGEQAGVGAEFGGARGDAAVGIGVKRDGRARVGADGCVVGNPIRNGGVGEDGAAEPGAGEARVEAGGPFEEFEQVDGLVVAPVADGSPVIVRLGDLPIDAGAGDAVGVVAVGGGGVDEFGDDAFAEGREGDAEGLPVLEDVAPVALVVEDAVAGGVAHADVETVPRAAGVAVAAAESEGQVFEGDAFEVGIAGGGEPRDEVGVGEAGGEAGDERGVADGGGAVAQAGEVEEVRGVHLMAEGEDAAAHDVEKGVGEMVGGGDLVAAELKAVGGGDQGAKAGGAGGEAGVEFAVDVDGIAQAVGEFGDVDLGAVGVERDAPAAGLAGGEGEFALERVAGAGAAGAGGVGRAAGEEAVVGVGRKGDAGFGPALGPHDGGEEGLHRDGAVDDAGGKGEDGEGSAGNGLGGFIGVGEAGVFVLEALGDAGDHEIADAVEDADGGVVAAQVFDFNEADQPVFIGGGPAAAEGDTEGGVDFLEPDTIAFETLVDVALDRVVAGAVGGERFPKNGLVAAFAENGGAAAGVGGGVVDAVNGLVGEEGVVGVGAAGAERAVAGEEKPDVGAADDVHEEHRHAVDIRDAVVASAEAVDETVVGTGFVEFGLRDREGGCGHRS